MRAKRMVQKMLCRPVVGVGRPRHQNDRQVLSVRAADRIEGRKRSNAERDDGGGGAAYPSALEPQLSSLEQYICFISLFVRS